MPGPYNLTVPNSANKFTYGGTEYAGGSTFHTDSACEAIAFYNAARSTNPDIGRSDEPGSRGTWSTIDAECSASNPAPPPDAPPGPPSEAQPGADGDSAQAQGAPTPPPTIGGDGSTPGQSTDGGTGDSTTADPAPTEEPTRPPEGEPHPTHSDDQTGDTTTAGDPVDIFNGSFYLNETDLIVPNTVMPLAFTRTYRSGAAAFGALGWNWDHNWNSYLRELNSGDIAVWRNLHEDIFKFDGHVFEPPRGIFERLDVIGSQVYEIAQAEGIVLRYERPAGWIDGERIPLTSIEDRHGNRLDLIYNSQDQLIQVIDNDERFLQFEYDECGLLVTVSDAAGRLYRYTHDEQTMQLICVEMPAIADFPDGIRKIFHYANPWSAPELRHNIVRVEDAEGNIYVENTYDEDPASWSYARVTEQLYGGHLFQFCYLQLQYVPDNDLYVNIPAVQVQLMNPDFNLETYTFNFRGDLLDRRYRLVKDHSFRIAAWMYEYDAQGNQTKLIRPDGSEEIRTFDPSNTDPRMRGLLLQRELTAASGFPAPSRIVWRGSYDPDYQLITEEKNEAGHTTTYRYDFNLTPAAPNNTGKLLEIIYPDATQADGTTQSAVTRFTYQANGQVSTTILPNGMTIENQYGNIGNEKNRLITIINDAGGLNISQQYQYDSQGYLSTTVDGNHQQYQQTYNALGLIEAITLPAINSQVARFGLHYDADRNIIASEKPKGSYQDSSLTDPFILDQFERDVLGYPTRMNLAANTLEARQYRITCNDYRGFPLEVVNPDGSRIKKVVDERGLLYEETLLGTDGKAITTKHVYDRAGKLTQSTDPHGLTTHYEYDGFSRLSKITLPNDTTIHYTWLKDDLLASEETIGDDGSGTIRQLAYKSHVYDERKRRISTSDKVFTDDPSLFVNITTTYFYDEMDRVVKSINARGGESVYHYDLLGRLSSQVDAEGNEIRYTYDNNNNVTLIEQHDIEPDASISTTFKQFNYDARNRLIEIIEPDGAKIEYTYDDRNLKIIETDQLGVVKQTVFNAFEQKTSSIQDVGGLNITSRWVLDNMSRVVSFIDPAGESSQYQYDSIGRGIETHYSNGLVSTKTFNDKHLVTQEKTGSGAVFDYHYDAANRLLTIENTAVPALVSPVNTHTFVYDGLNRVLTAAHGTHNTIRRYDSMGRLYAEETTGCLVEYHVDDITGIATKSWNDGRTEAYAHNLNGILTSIDKTTHGTLGTAALSNIAQIAPSGANMLGSVLLDGSTQISNRFDERKRLTDINISNAIGTNETIHYRYNASNHKQVEAILGQNQRLNFYEFDARNRLTKAQDQFNSIVAPAFTQADHDTVINQVKAAAASATHVLDYQYGAADNRTMLKETGLPDKNYSFASGHKISNDGSNAYTYLTDGTRNADGNFDYEADAFGRILRIKSGTNIIAALEYDAYSRPISIKESGQPDKTLHYFGAHLTQINQAGVPARQMTVHPQSGVPIAYHSALGSFFTLFDARYNLIGLLDNSGALVESYRYEAFGLPTTFDSTGSVITSSAFGVEPVFGGQYYLASTGLYLAKRRLMDPVNGVYLSADPRGYLDSPSLYVYVIQNPIDYIDPDGEFAFLAVLAVMAVGALVAGGLNAVRQGIAISEGSQEGWEWGQFGASVGIGAIAAPVLVFAPELAVPLAAWGVANGIGEISEGHYGTGAFDIITSVAPFGFKGPRTATFGAGTRFGQMRGLGPSASWGARAGRFTLIGNGIRNFTPPFWGRRIGLGFSRVAPGEAEGHVALTFEGEPNTTPWFVEKNAARLPNGDLIASFREMEAPPEFYMRPRPGREGRPFEYDSIRIPESSLARARAYAESRITTTPYEPFDPACQNCSHFAADVLGQAGFENFGTGRASGLWGNFRNFGTARTSAYSAPFFAEGIHPNTKPDSAK